MGHPVIPHPQLLQSHYGCILFSHVVSPVCGFHTLQLSSCIMPLCCRPHAMLAVEQNLLM